MVPPNTLEHSSEEPQVISLDNLCMMDGSWTSSTQFSGYGWVWKDNWKNPTYGDTKLKKERNCFIFESRSTVIGNGEHATTFVMSELRDRLHGSDCDDKGNSSLTKFCNMIEVDTDIADMFSGFQNISYPKSKKKWNFKLHG